MSRTTIKHCLVVSALVLVGSGGMVALAVGASNMSGGHGTRSANLALVGTGSALMLAGLVCFSCLLSRALRETYVTH